ncbi:NB-ARC domain-containing protein [Actinoplanes sp. KI2]|uniref:AfsR/SARP family transcriptional regulator n=1 Tax=Actinoplanes sp. KI2 TaxID=2983315 RepID=UPI0021D56C9C|nr:BTAD domain-containing putative transcriptional regulator [Actinoplanes sp. KI2]MCU7731129.1 NB-ARC domain-containing protein [Actinoplanes sp. KI2]
MVATIAGQHMTTCHGGIVSVALRILGTVEMVADSEPVAIHGLKPRLLLAALVVGADRQVPTERLIDALWGDAPPRSASENLRTYATTLRRGITTYGGDPSSLTTSRVGFTLRSDRLDLDVERFRAAAARARGAGAAGQTGAAVELFGTSLSLWRGVAAQDLPRDGWLGRALCALDEQHLTVVEDHAEAQLRLGLHQQVAARLAGLVVEHPLRERLWRLLMTAQYRCGDISAALASFGQARAALADHLGVDPGPELDELHRSILRREPHLAAPTTAPPIAVISPAPTADGPITDIPAAGCTVPPHQLPARTAVFVGRHRELAEVTEALQHAAAGEYTGVLIHGTPGVGTSTLAIHAAHAVRDLFPDGQLYVDLREEPYGRGDTRLRRVAERLLRGLNIRVPTPDTGAEASAALRSVLARRRILLVVDNTDTSDQLAGLLPAGEGSAALVVCRTGWPAPGIGRTVTLRPLSTASSVDLLERAVGPATAGAMPHALAAIAGYCAGLPIAIKAAADRISSRSNWSLQHTQNRLARPHCRLSELSVGRHSVRESLLAALADASKRYSMLPTAFSSLADFERPFEVDEAARVCRVNRADMEASLARLVDFGLLETVAPEHFRLPPLTRLLAMEQRRQPRTPNGYIDNVPVPRDPVYPSLVGSRPPIKLEVS